MTNRYFTYGFKFICKFLKTSACINKKGNLPMTCGLKGAKGAHQIYCTVKYNSFELFWFHKKVARMLHSSNESIWHPWISADNFQTGYTPTKSTVASNFGFHKEVARRCPSMTFWSLSLSCTQYFKRPIIDLLASPQVKRNKESLEMTTTIYSWTWRIFFFASLTFWNCF